MQEIYFLVMHAGAIQREPFSPTLVSCSEPKLEAARTIKDFKIENISLIYMTRHFFCDQLITQ